MALIKWEPLREIEDLFGHSLAWPLGRAQSMLGLGDWNPRVDISESNGPGGAAGGQCAPQSGCPLSRGRAGADRIRPLLKTSRTE